MDDLPNKHNVCPQAPIRIVSQISRYVVFFSFFPLLGLSSMSSPHSQPGSSRHLTHATGSEASPAQMRRSSPVPGIDPGPTETGVHASMYEDFDRDQKLRAKLERSVDSDYFRPKRANQLLAEAQALTRGNTSGPGVSPPSRTGTLPHPSQLPPSLSGPPPGQLKPLNWHSDSPSTLPKLSSRSNISSRDHAPSMPNGGPKSRHGTLEPLNDKRFYRRP